jgi:hypothetical protein
MVIILRIIAVVHLATCLVVVVVVVDVHTAQIQAVVVMRIIMKDVV